MQIQIGLNSTAPEDVLWALLKLDISDNQVPLHDVFDCIEEAPPELGEVIEAVLKSYRSGPELNPSTELNLILSWMTNTMQSSSLSEFNEILDRSSVPHSGASSVGKHIRQHYGNMLKLVRDDGVHLVSRWATFITV
jgi:hypothetical protein